MICYGQSRVIWVPQFEKHPIKLDCELTFRLNILSRNATGLSVNLLWFLLLNHQEAASNLEIEFQFNVE